MRTLHVGLRVADLDRSLAFYRALGYIVVGTAPETPIGQLAMLRLPADEFVTLELVHDPDAGAVHPAGISHLVVQVEDVHELVARLVDSGMHIEPPTSPNGSDDFWSAMLTDPDGYRIELVQWPAGHPPGMTEVDFTS